MQIKSKEATAIINSLVGGVVPKIGIQHITVGRKKEISALIKALEEVKDDHSIVKFWIGEFGSGKSFMLHLLNTIAIKQKFVVSNADFSPERRLYSNDRKAVALYTAIINNLSINTKPDGGALEILLEKWVENVLMSTAQEYNLSFDDLKLEENTQLVRKNIMKTTHELSGIGGFNFGNVIIKYYEGFINDDPLLKRSALRWLKGDYTTKTEARQDLGVREIINDQNYYDMLKNFCQFFRSIGYKGLMINLDEAINLYKIPNRQMREKNYEKILTIYNDCFQGNTKNLFINFAGTIDFLKNERRGLFSYNALKTRLEGNQFESQSLRDFSQPVINLLPLNDNEIFVLLKKLKEIFDLNYSTQINFTEDDIKKYMEYKLNEQGASEFLMPREVIRHFINILNILRQNPSQNKDELMKTYNRNPSGEEDLDGISIVEF